MPRRIRYLALLAGATALLAAVSATAQTNSLRLAKSTTKPAMQKPAPLSPAEASLHLKLPANFKAVVVADKIGSARHLLVTKQGDVYVRLANPVNGHGTLRLRDTDANGTLDEQVGFGEFGGTGIALQNGYLYTSSNTAVYRYQLNEKQEVLRPDQPECIVTGLIDRGTHNTKSLALDGKGNLYVVVGAPSNNCQEKDRALGSPALQPCGLLDSVGGIWQFKVDKANQREQNGVRYATGLRNVVGLDWNTQTNSLFVMQHGRDQLSYLYPKLYDDKKSATTPAECLFELVPGSNAGWPYVYYDLALHKKIVSPEYGGDGRREGGSEYLDPAAAYPAHMAPNGLLFYTGTAFPEKYRHGAFIAFHGSWNRSPEPQAGYCVAFQPFKDGKPNGDWEVFADGFSGLDQVISTGKAQRRPCGLALGPDGALYVSDDVKGTIYKIMYHK